MQLHSKSTFGAVKVIQLELWTEYWGKQADILGMGIFPADVFPEGRKRTNYIHLGGGGVICVRKAGPGDCWCVKRRNGLAEQSRIQAYRERIAAQREAERDADEKMRRNLDQIPVRHDDWLSEQADYVSRFLDISLSRWLSTDCGLGIAAADMAAIRELALQLEQRVRRSTVVLNESARQAYVRRNTPVAARPRGATQPRVRHLRVVA